MYKKAALLTFYAETPIHMGSGQSVSYVDLPIQRERHTSFPVLWASGIKGVIRNLALREWNDKDKINTIFGPDPEDASDFASCISITDAKILLYPVRSVKGVFAWITCPFVLKRFKEDLKAIRRVDSKVNDLVIQIPETSDNKVIIANDNLKIQEKNMVALEEFLFEPEVKDDAKNLAKKLKEFIPTNDLTNSLENHLAIVSDNVFKDFVNYAVEIRTRIRIDQAKGTVKEGALFSEELVPSESVFYSLVFITDPYFEIEMDLYNELKSKKEKNEKPDWDAVKNRLKGSEDAKKKVLERLKKAWENGYFVDDEIKNSLKFLDNSLPQLGGDETIGRGLVRVKFYSPQGG
jgi:CRISPR-associated protein Cmr4